MSISNLLNKMKELSIKTPLLGSALQDLYVKLLQTKFKNSTDYWIDRYSKGGNSGPGSYEDSAIFKAETLNAFVKENKISTVIEFGCGDGNQLKLSNYENYLGFDISPDAINQCRKIFHNDFSKKFKLINDYTSEKADLILSLDVLYHLTEDEVFDKYMKILFSAANKYIIFFSTNTDNQREKQAPHVRHRNFTKWIDRNTSNWNLINYIPNKSPSTEKEDKNFTADFFIYKKS